LEAGRIKAAAWASQVGNQKERNLALGLVARTGAAVEASNEGAWRKRVRSMEFLYP